MTIGPAPGIARTRDSYPPHRRIRWFRRCATPRSTAAEAAMISSTQASGARGPVVSDTGSSPPIRGRDEQLQMIAGFLERVRAGAGAVAIIEGAAGLGKTRLLTAASAAARALSFRTGLGAAEPGHSSVELAVLMEALFGGAESLVEWAALGSRDGSREESFWLLQDVETLMERAALRQPLLV